MKIKANGILVNYELSGPERAPVVMLSHSLSATFNMWDAQMPALTERYRVLRYDLRGHGDTEATSGPYSLELLANDAEALLVAVGIERCHFVGLSLGGMIGQALAVRPARALASAVLCDTASAIPEQARSTWDDRIRVAQEQGMESLADGTLDRWFSKDFQSRGAAQVQAVRRMIVSTPVAGYVGCCNAIKALNLTDRLSSVRIPTLVVVGKDDPGTPVAAAQVIQAQIPGAQLVVLEQALHLPNIEQAEAFNTALRKFLDAL